VEISVLLVEISGVPVAAAVAPFADLPQ